MAMKPTVIFSTDNQTDIAANYRAEKHLAALKATGKTGPITPPIGSYKGKLERSWAMDLKDFVNYVKDTDFVKGQESFLIVYDNPREQALLWFRDDTKEPVGVYTPISSGDINKYRGWTYNPYHNVYFTFVKES